MAKRVLKTVDEDHYVTINTAEKLRIVRDQLHGKESDHFRLSQTPEDTTPAQLETIKEQVVRLREKEVELSAEVEAEEAKEETDDDTG